MALTAEQKQLLAFLERRHPRYEELLPHWEFCQATYEGGRAWFAEGNIFKYHKEGDDEFRARVERAFRFNHTKEAVDLVQKYIFKSPVTRNEEDASPEVQEFWKNATLSGLDINQFMGLVSAESSKKGMPWCVVDSNRTQAVLSVEDAKKAGVRAYVYMVAPEDVLDVGYSRYGELNWVLIREHVRDAAIPIFSSGETFEQYRLWERDRWRLYEIVEETNKGGKTKEKRVELVDEREHALGVVPAFPVPHTVGEHRYAAPGLIDDIVYLDRAIANYLSNLDAIIQDQTFSQLAMPAQQVMPGQDEYNMLLDMGTKRVFVYDGEGGGKPEYLSPDPKQAHLILAVIEKIINEIYHTIGMAGERTKQDNAVGIDNSSGVAKAYDFERLNSLLTAKADSLENAENKLVALVQLWNSSTPPAEELVKYPDTFDVRGLRDEFEMAKALLEIEAPDLVRREQMKGLVEKLWPRLSADLQAKFKADIEGWEPPTQERLTEKKAKASQAAKPVPPSSNRQGQVTKTTGKK